MNLAETESLFTANLEPRCSAAQRARGTVLSRIHRLRQKILRQQAHAGSAVGRGAK